VLFDEEIGLTLVAEVPGQHRGYISMPPVTVARLGKRKAIAMMRDAVINEFRRRGWKGPVHWNAFMGEVPDWTVVPLQSPPAGANNAM
jgi:hypothetical protein